MCIFSQPVSSVTNTKIFARLLPDGWQHLVYQMNFESNLKNAIILPLPVRVPASDEGSLKFISLKNYERFFADLERGFPIVLPQGPARSGGIASNSARPKLVVHKVGDFIASFVPALSDFDRLDEQFRIPQESWDKLPVYSDYGFAVFQLEALRGKPHPMAFKFRSRLTEGDERSVFFPTVHIHDGEVHAREAFDHILYLQAPEFDRVCGDYQKRGYLVTDEATGYVRSNAPAGEFCDVEKSMGILDADGLVHRREMKGRFPNKDVRARLAGSVASTQSLFSPLGGMTAVACVGGLAGLTWFINRRNVVSSAPREA